MIVSPEEARIYLNSLTHGGLTEVSDKTGVHIVQLCRIRKGRVKNPSCHTLQRITDYIACLENNQQL